MSMSLSIARWESPEEHVSILTTRKWRRTPVLGGAGQERAFGLGTPTMLQAPTYAGIWTCNRRMKRKAIFKKSGLDGGCPGDSKSVSLPFS
jgi:hypothetical protein